MTIMDIVDVATIHALFEAGNLGQSNTNLVDVDDDLVFKIESIFLCNADTVNTCTVTIEVSWNNGGAYFYLCNGLVIPPATTISLIDRPLFLDETDIIRGSASADGDIDYVVSGTKLNDA